MSTATGVRYGSVDEREEEEELGFVSVNYTRGLGRKRIVISSDAAARAPLKRQCSGRVSVFARSSALETLPQDILVRILCGVEHGDLKQLVGVSKSIKDAALIAKQLHFAYKTPTKTQAFRDPTDLRSPSDFDSIQTPEAPRRIFKPRLCRKRLIEISSVLFD
ncbi:hypothetical protein SAY86_007926 [Trapa natans]|uniref:F-box domain-containing protein n=1 Tax=Trapa natans TaxID=22666 RepID=A0AAN7LBS4_TRANT|nr:hypothetical protein SAY86_007926 [Trapa natans]